MSPVSKSLILDTAEQVADMQVECWRRMTPAEKLAVVHELNQACEALSVAGVRMRNPDASDDDVRLRVIALRLGRTLSIAAYGWDPHVKGW